MNQPTQPQTQTPAQQKQQSALTRVLQSNLCLEMADKYKVAPDQLFGVLVRTVFPKNREGKIEATVEQFVAFLSVAQQYDLNPFTRQIYAFPSKSGGVIPIVPIDGWVTIIQRKKSDVDGLPALAGIRFVDEFEMDSVTGKKDKTPYAIKCIIKRRDMDETEITEYMSECVRETDAWKKWPTRMLRHKALIQCARVAFGLSGIYDQDEAERIIEVESRQENKSPQIVMPQRVTPTRVEQRVTQIRVGPEASGPESVEDVINDMDAAEKPQPPQPEQQQPAATNSEPEPEVNVAESAPMDESPEAEESPVAEVQPALIEEPAGKPTPKQKLIVPAAEQIGTGARKKIFAVMNSAKVRTEKDLYAHIWLEYGVEHVHELPKTVMNEVLAWVGGDKMKIK